jgi:hypothetical protein
VAEELVEHRGGRLSTTDHRDALGGDAVVLGGPVPELRDGYRVGPPAASAVAKAQLTG